MKVFIRSFPRTPFLLPQTIGFSNVTQGPLGNQLIFFLQGYNTPEVKTFTFLADYASSTPWIDFCVTDVACVGSVASVLTQNSTSNSTFEPTTSPFIFDSVVRYQVLEVFKTTVAADLFMRIALKQTAKKIHGIERNI